MQIFQTKSLGFSFHSTPLFKHLNLQLNAGQLLWVQGPNGAGKTTLLKCLAGLTQPTRGQILWEDLPHNQHPNFAQSRQWIGHKTPLKDALTGLENLSLLCATQPPIAAKDQPYAPIDLQQSLETLALKAVQHQPVKNYSAGMKRRLLLAKLLCRPTPLWILDEPMNALDIKGTELFQNLANQHLKQGGMIVLSSHLPLPNIQPERLTTILLAPHGLSKS